MNLENGIMSPVDKSSCTIIYIIGIVCFIYAIVILFIGVYLMFSIMNMKVKDKGMIMMNLGFHILSVMLVYLLAYYLYRIQYTICLKVL